MKSNLSRSFLLGLGSGLVLSAFITMIFIALPDRQEPKQNFPANIQTPQEDDSTNKDAELDTEVDKEENDVDKKENNEEDTPVLFIISAGDSAGDIANRLVNEQWINAEEKVNFLNFINENRLANKFRVGKYKLVPGLTIEEIVNRLINR